MQYQIVHATAQSELEERVRELINLGWRPLGGVSAAGLFDAEPGYYVQHREYNQAMIKEDMPDER